jgi:hypothetical protein
MVVSTGATSGAGIAYPSEAPEWLCICVLGVLILTLFLRFYDWFWSCSDSGICLCFPFYCARSKIPVYVYQIPITLTLPQRYIKLSILFKDITLLAYLYTWWVGISWVYAYSHFSNISAISFSPHHDFRFPPPIKLTTTI